MPDQVATKPWAVAASSSRHRARHERHQRRDAPRRTSRRGEVAASAAARPADRTPSRSSAGSRQAPPIAISAVGLKRLQPRRDREQHDLGCDAEPPERADQRAVHALRRAIARSRSRNRARGCPGSCWRRARPRETPRLRSSSFGDGRGAVGAGSAPESKRHQRDRGDHRDASAATISQIRWPGDSHSSSTPAATLPAMKATEPHSRTGP